jgi:hypothetical protein
MGDGHARTARLPATALQPVSPRIGRHACLQRLGTADHQRLSGKKRVDRRRCDLLGGIHGTSLIVRATPYEGLWTDGSGILSAAGFSVP